jgi:flagellar biosynthetic protein FliQ
MNADIAIDICRRAMEVCVLILLPVLLAALCAGVMAGLFQAATQLQEPTLTFVPKILALGGALMIFGPWMLDRLRVFTVETITLVGLLHR